MTLLAPSITGAVGMRSERPWLVPVPAVRPSVSVTPRLFSPDGDGVDETVRIRLGVANPRSLAAWHFYVMAPDGTVFLSRAGTSAPPEPLTWDGAYDVGEPTGVKLDIEPATDYRVILDTSDILGRAQRAETTLTVDILVIKEGDHYKIRVPDIIFPSNSAELSAKNSRDLLAANRRVLERIATLFARFPGYSLAVEGHANAVYWSDPKRREKEQTEELIPLSRRRAESVKQALILLGIDAARIRTVARGGTAPLSAFADSGSAWKNRRVEFILEK
jgi:outer membrane protein OmpA-like peptidoglycan-associated protein